MASIWNSGASAALSPVFSRVALYCPVSRCRTSTISRCSTCATRDVGVWMRGPKGAGATRPARQPRSCRLPSSRYSRRGRGDRSGSGVTVARGGQTDPAGCRLPWDRPGAEPPRCSGRRRPTEQIARGHGCLASWFSSWMGGWRGAWPRGSVGSPLVPSGPRGGVRRGRSSTAPPQPLGRSPKTPGPSLPGTASAGSPRGV